MNKKPLIALMSVVALAACQDQKVESPQPAEQPVMADSAHSARTALDWNGIYKGSVPCSDCAGTNLLLELKMDGQYSLGRSYMDKMSAMVMEEGEFTWNDAGNAVQVGEYRFFVAENQLFLVASDEQRLVDDDGEPYTLSKDMM
ncbi:hypothetical protein BCU68_04560 [Vibrio sp. 10N.286.49.B3]|uniref:copper resistance protein NlpE n=1 Tax=Vibrio sp. 10N.286.49.B3 TaxID=1880855 RepID=UPI000C83171D|nr:copper resistance protein NlpE N-terminal domain-containing protein [Vibrio sp. 10N.286.49.B3]PMH43263.1 hypothetical protein BCU68_04560 [Vibrio sp. 10N.286.49.B3]